MTFRTASLRRSTLLALPLLLCAMAVASAQGTGTIVGTMTGENEGLLGGVQILGTTRGAAADIDGTFEIPGIPAGTHTLLFTSVGYLPDTVEGVVVTAGETVTVDVQLRPDDVETVVTKYGTRTTNSAAGAIDARKNARQITEVMSSEEISNSGASNAGDAVEKQTGVTVVGDKAIVRGLKPRYTSAQMNGAPMPSPEPETKALPLDLFPAGMIDNITTVKTFTPDNPGDFAGGLVKINTKNFPSRFILNVGVGTGLNTVTQGADALAYSGGGTDWLGIDDGSRELPESVASQVGGVSGRAEEADLLAEFGERPWRPETTTLPLNGSVNVTIGNRFGEEKPVGILFSTTWGADYTYREGIDRYAENTVDVNGNRNFFYDYTTRQATESVLWGSLLNLSLGLGEESTVGFKGMINHSSDDESLLVTGLYNASTVGEVRRTQMRFVERTIMTGQLIGDHVVGFPSERSRIEWRTSLSAADRHEPDNRQTAYLRSSEEEPYRYNGNFGSSNGRFFSDLSDIEASGGLDWMIPLYLGDDDQTTSTSLKVGTLNRYRTRDFTARRFVFGLSGEAQPSDAELDPEELYTPDAVRRGAVSFQERTTATDAYEAEEVVVAGYAMIEAPVVEKVRLIAGARVEFWDLTLLPFNQFIERTQPQFGVERSVVDVLPSLNLIWSPTEKMSVRGALSQTLARPEFREVAPFRFDDYKLSTFGNPTLERTRIQNLDLRWELYPRAGELFAVSGFYKNFVNPIETFFLLGGSDLQVEPVNADGATTIGAEFEIRKSLDGVVDLLQDFSIGGNLTLTHSAVRFEEGGSVTTYTGQSVSQKPVSALTNLERPMQGQSPYVVNVVAGYDNSTTGTEVNLLFNVFGERLATIGTEGFPDVYEQPQSMLDLTMSQRLPGGLQLSLKAKNLLDADILYTQEFTGENAETVEVERWSVGRSLSLGLSFSLDRLKLHN